MKNYFFGISIPKYTLFTQSSYDFEYMSATDTLQPNPIDMVFYGSDMGLQTNPKRGGTGPNFKRSKKNFDSKWFQFRFSKSVSNFFCLDDRWILIF